MEHLYKPINPTKYIGNSSRIYYRSSWEKKFMQFLELSPKIKRWASEEIVIAYFLESDKKWHRYYPDFFVEFQTEHKFIIEIKPFSQRLIIPGKRIPRAQQLKFLQNQTKWLFANNFAKENGMIFLVFDEYDLRKLGLQIPIPSTKIPKQKQLYEQSSPYGNSVSQFITPLITEYQQHENSRK